MSRRGADVVVVGAGMAGLEAAAELCAGSSAQVLVVDGATGAGTGLWRSQTPPHYPQRSEHLNVGGRSLAWHGVVLPLEDWALADWPAVIAEDLQRRWYGEVRRDLVAWAGQPLEQPAGADGQLAARLQALTGAAWSPVAQAVRDAGGRRRAYSPVDRLPGDGRQLSTVSGAAVEVVVSGGRATGVRLAGGDVVYADEVLVAAGSVESTRLVAQARRRPGQTYQVVDHLVEGFLVRLPAGALPPGGLVRWEADARCRSAIFARTHPAEDGHGLLLDVWTMGEQLPSAAANIVFAGEGPAPWPCLVRAGLSAADEQAIAAGRRRLERVRAAVGASGDEQSWPSLLDAPRGFAATAAAAEAAPQGQSLPYAWPLGTVDHEGSTLPFGTELDDAGRVMDVPGLWVAGPATFPRPGAANPSLTTLALARRTGSFLAGEESGSPLAGRSGAGLS